MSRAARPAALLLAALLAGGAVALGGAPLLESWLPAFLFWAGIALGALGLLAIGHLLGEEWLRPVRDELEAAARSLPALALLALPVLFGLDRLYPWAVDASALPPLRAAWLEPGFFRLRAAGFMALWVVLAFALARPGRHKLLGGLTLGLLAPSVGVAAQDWVLSRDPLWFASLQGFTLCMEQLLGALAAGLMMSLLRGERPERSDVNGLARALLTLALAVLWLRFLQFLVVWFADLPAEAGWYIRRAGWAWLNPGFGLGGLIVAILLGLRGRMGRLRLGAVCLLLLVQHAAHLLWVLRPEARGPLPPPWLDAAVSLALAAGFAAWWLADLRRGPQGPPQPAA